MATINSQGQVVYQGGEALPTVGSSAYVAAQNGQINPLNSYTGESPAPISSANLSSGATPLTLPSSSISSSVSGAISGAADSSISSTEKLLADQLAMKQAQQSSNTTMADTSRWDTFKKIIGVQESRPQVEADLMVNDLAKVNNDAFTALQASKRAQEVELKNAMSKAGGTTGGAQDAVNEINRKYAFEQADLSIALDVANRSYTAAQNTADRKIQMQLEPLTTLLNFQQEFYKDNKADLTKTEDRQLQQLIDKNKTELEQKKTDLQNISAIQLEAAKNGADAMTIQNIGKATDVSGAIQAAGSFAGDSLDRQYKQAQLNKLNVDNAKTIAETKALGVDGITNPEAAKYSTALNTILGSGKFTKDQKADVIRAVNNGEDPFSVIKNQAKNIMGQTLATQLDKYETAKSQMENISQLLNVYYANGGKTNVFTGNYEKTLNKLGEVNDPNLVSIATNISSALQIYRNAVSGTAYSVQEGKDIASIFPGVNKTEGLNRAILSGRLNAFNTSIDSQYRNTLGKTYDDILNSAKKDTTTNDPLGLGIANTSTSTNPLGL